MASLRKNKTVIRTEDLSLSSDSDFDSDEDNPFGALHKGDEQNYNLDQRVMARYGTNVQHKKSLTNYYIQIIGFVAVLIFIPSEIVLRNTIFESERSAIKSYQEIINSIDADTFFKQFWILFTWVGRYLFVKCVASFLYLFADPVLGFKSALTLYAGAFIITILKMFYKVPRPFWIDSEIKGKECLMDFSGPSEIQFFMTYFYSYNIIMFFIMYAEKPNKTFAAICLSGNAFLVVIAALWLNYLGVTFYLESLTGSVYGILYCALCITFDSEIHKFSEMTGFIIKTSKKYKFYALFIVLFAFWCALVYYNSELITWRAPQNWIVNSQGIWNFDEDFEIRLGIDDTFKETSAIFGIIGVSFGASHATKVIDNVTWGHANFWLRILRGLLGVAIYVGIFVAFNLIPRVDLPTAYFF